MIKKNNEVELIGIANHIYDDKSLNSLKIKLFPKMDKEGGFVTIEDSNGNSVIINSKEQWKQIDALVLKALDNLED